MQTQVRTLLDEKADLLLQIQDQTREIAVLRRSLGFGEDKPSDVKGCNTSQAANDDLQPLLIERDCLKIKVRDLEHQLKKFKCNAETDVLVEETTPDNSM